MSRALVVLYGRHDREKAAGWVSRAPVGSRVEFKGPARSLDQNSTMWLWLTALATKLDWHGQKYSPDDWKDYLMHSFKRARWMPDEDGGMVPIGMRTSDLSKEEMSDFIELIIAFATRHGVTLPELETSPTLSQREAG